MKRIRPDLWQSRSAHPFGDAVGTHAYLLEITSGNVLFYNTPNEPEIDAMAELGGAAYQCLSHRHEAAPNLRHLGRRLGCRLVADAAESLAIAAHRPVDFVVTASRDIGPVLALPTPGHTLGGICFVYASPHGRYLFSGDLLYVEGDRLSTRVCSAEGGNRRVLRESLEVLRPLRPDWVFSSAFCGAGSSLKMNPRRWIEELDRNARALE